MEQFVVACCNSGKNNGGFCLVNENLEVDVIDSVSTAGLTITDNIFFRAIQKNAYLELLSYNVNGKVKRNFYSEITDIHDIYYKDKYIYIVATGTNEIYKIDEGLKIVDIYKFEGTGDSWHLNCLTEIEGDVYSTAFCDYFEHYNYKNNATNQGFLINIETKERNITGLSQPHSPFYFDKNVYICNSETKSLLIKDLKNNTLEEVIFKNYTRGLYVTDDYIYVGLSKSRDKNTKDKSAKVAILNRHTLSLINEVNIPFDEIYDIKVIPEKFINSIKSYKYQKQLINYTRIKVKTKKFMNKFFK